MIVEPSKERWKNSLLIGLSIIFTNWLDKKLPDSNKKQGMSMNIFLVLIGTLDLLFIAFIFLVCHFIEMPIRYVIFKGNFKDKLKQWVNGWKQFFKGIITI